MPYRIRHRSKRSANVKPYRSVRAHPGLILPPCEQHRDELQLKEFIAELKKTKKKRKKHADNQSDQQVEADLKS